MGGRKAVAAAARVESKLESREKMLVLAYVGPHWAKRVTFLGTAPSPGGHVGCILGLCWLTLSHMGGPSWAKRYISSHRAQSRWACWVHIGLVLAYVGPHGQGTGLFI